MKQEITIIDVMQIIIIILFVAIMIWWVLGSSPTLQVGGFILSLIFLFYTFKNDRDMKIVKNNTGQTLNKLYNIDDILKERLK